MADWIGEGKGSPSLVTERERENWEKVYWALKEANKTDSYFYRRAKQIIETGMDPGLPPLRLGWPD